MKLSVVIPSYNSADILPETLRRLEEQTLPKEEFEVILINDGSTDATERLLQEYEKVTSLQFHWESQENAGQGNARNKALAHVQAPITCIIGADAFLDSRCLEEHLKVHEAYTDEAVGCLGHATWDPAVGISPLMYFLEHGGHQFAYDKASKGIKTKEGYYHVDYRFFYTINVSIKTSLLKQDSFDPKFTSYGWEDIELARRLEKKHQFQLLYNPAAKVWHHDKVTEEAWEARMTDIATNGVYFEAQCPEVQVLPHGVKSLIFRFLAWGPIRGVFWLLKTILPVRPTYFLYFYSLMKHYTFKGIAQAKKGA